MYHELRTLAFQFASDITPPEHEFSFLEFPEHWKNSLRKLQSEAWNRSPDKVTIPVKNLNKALRALVPDLISIVPNAHQSGKRSWLYSTMHIEEKSLYSIVSAWVRTEFPKASYESRNRVLTELQPEDLIWKSKTLDLTSWTQEENGTAKLNGDAFVVLPDFLAARLSQSDVSIRFGPNPLHFRRAPLAPGRSGAELVSWPPLWHTDRQGNQWAYSVVLLITVQTIPFQSFPVIHCDFSLRRWGSQPIRRIPGGEETSMALLTKVPWLRGLHHSNSFQVAPVKWSYIPEKDRQEEESKFRLTWGSNLVSLLDKLHFQRPFPDPQEIIESPEAAMNLDGKSSAAIFFRHGMKPKHGVGAGLLPGDRHPLAEQLAGYFKPFLVFTDPLKRAEYSVSREANPFFEKIKKSKKSTGEDEIAQAKKALYEKCRGLINAAVGDRLTIEIRYQSSTIRNAFIKAICEILGLTIPADTPHTWHTPELILTLETELLGPIGSELGLDQNIKGEKDRLHRAINQRVDQIKESISLAMESTATLIELAGKDGFKGDEDPKYAIRKGFAHVGRLTQFITPEKSDKQADDEEKASLPHRAKASILDMIRQLGVQIGKPKIALDDLPDPLHYVGLWLIKQYASSSPTRTQQMLPVLVYMASNTTGIKATAPGLDWLSYSEALLAIAQGKTKGFQLNELRKAMPVIRKKIEEVASLGHTLLLCHAQNSRQMWSWLANKKITIDNLAFGNGNPQPITDWPELRIVRVRDSQGNETPEWYAQDEDKIGFAKGLFQMTDRVFASTYDKGKQQKGISPSISKAKDWKGLKMKESRPPLPGTNAWNPGLFELTVAGLQPDDKAWLWAVVAHELRNIALHYDEPTALPLPLHLAKQMKEYSLSLI